MSSDSNSNSKTETPKDDSYLAHPEKWTTGGEPATDKQKGFIHVLAQQNGKPDPEPEQMTKSEASEAIEEMKKA